MTDVLTPQQRALNMRRIRGRDTKPEMVMRRALHAAGLRFRLHRRDLPGRPDLVFPRYGVAMFVHGCFWHGHGCSLFRWPATRDAFWRAKIAGNMERDQRAADALLASGWRVIVVWECSLKGTGRRTAAQIAALCAQFVAEGGGNTLEVSESGPL